MDWDPRFLNRSPMFEPLRGTAPEFGAEWPDLAALQRALDARDLLICNAQRMPLRLVAPARGAAAPEDGYETRVYQRGELQVRSRNWHDLLNVLVWLAFPRAKAALNARHHAEAAGRSAGNRGPAQDALTLLDEGGMIVVSSDGGLLDLLRGFAWKDLFWRRRNDVRSRMRFCVLGHALYKKALAPFAGITARAILLEATADPADTPPVEPLATLDARAAGWIENPQTLSRTRDLAPVPILGVPGWCAANEREEYYDDTEYFRPGRKGVTGDG